MWKKSKRPKRFQETQKKRFRRRNVNNNNQEEVNNNIVLNVENNHTEDSNLNLHTGRIHGKVKNLSTVQLTHGQQSLLELGPKFCPIEHEINRARFQKLSS